jgi:hypothetical protein
MTARGAKGRPERLFIGHVGNRVMDHHDIENASQVQRPHVADHVLAFRVDGATDLQHGW